MGGSKEMGGRIVSIDHSNKCGEVSVYWMDKEGVLHHDNVNLSGPEIKIPDPFDCPYTAEVAIQSPRHHGHPLNPRRSK